MTAATFKTVLSPLCGWKELLFSCFRPGQPVWDHAGVGEAEFSLSQARVASLPCRWKLERLIGSRPTCLQAVLIYDIIITSEMKTISRSCAGRPFGLRLYGLVERNTELFFSNITSLSCSCSSANVEKRQFNSNRHSTLRKLKGCFHCVGSLCGSADVRETLPREILIRVFQTLLLTLEQRVRS